MIPYTYFLLIHLTLSDVFQGYSELVAAYFDSLDSSLSQRCSSSVQVFVRFLDVQFSSTPTGVSANYTIQILPTVLQSVFYELCGLTLRTIFDLRIPGWTHWSIFDCKFLLDCSTIFFERKHDELFDKYRGGVNSRRGSRNLSYSLLPH